MVGVQRWHLVHQESPRIIHSYSGLSYTGWERMLDVNINLDLVEL